jgi:arylsulfatase
MGRPGSLRTWIFGAALVAMAGCTPDPRLSGLVITLDTTRADALSCLGGRPGTTPVLDSLAARSTLFAQARSETNVTGPSHVTILSGQRAIEHGVHWNGAPIPAGVVTLPELLHAKGWSTGAFVASRHLSTELGWRGFEELPPVAEQLTAEEVTDRAVAWLEGRAGRPFFLWVHYWDPHMQYSPPAELAAEFYPGDPTAGSGPRIADEAYFERFPREGVTEWLGDVRDPEWAKAMYAAELHYADREIRRLLDAARRTAGGQLVVAVTADHGESLGEHGIAYGHRGLYEPQLRVPLILHVPGGPPQRSDAMVSTLDVAPTLAELLGVELPAAAAGVSLAGLVRGADAAQEPPDRVHVYENARNQGVAVRKGDWKLIVGLEREHPLFAGPPELYDLAADPGETLNLAADHPEVVAELTGQLAPWLALGVIESGTMPHLDAEAVERLRALGYLQD